MFLNLTTSKRHEPIFLNVNHIVSFNNTGDKSEVVIFTSDGAQLGVEGPAKLIMDKISKAQEKTNV